MLSPCCVLRITGAPYRLFASDFAAGVMLLQVILLRVKRCMLELSITL